jgi:hypothetical protein
MAGDRSPDMNKQSANQGDRLKHALLLEVLEGTQAWPDVTYAETHAGSGIYRAKGQAAQKPVKQYIRLLREEVERTHLDEGDNGPGAAYLRWLKEWWGSPSNDDTYYPGSALTASHWLTGHRPPEQFEIRLTEGDKETCDDLRKALVIPEDQVKQGPFDVYLHWLTETDNLVLLVDPFGIVTKFGESGACCGPERGQIDHDVVKKILDLCAHKERAIVHFWWSSAQGYKYYHAATTCLFEGWRGQQGAVTHREFHDKYNHRSTIFGIGTGAEIVDGLPGRKSWVKSWLKSVIYEKPRRTTK